MLAENAHLLENPAILAENAILCWPKTHVCQKNSALA
jgi:hypothetical protein